MAESLKRKDLVYPELSYKIVGAAFKAFNEVGFGRSEKFYQKAFAQEMKSIQKDRKQYKKRSNRFKKSRESYKNKVIMQTRMIDKSLLRFIIGLGIMLVLLLLYIVKRFVL